MRIRIYAYCIMGTHPHVLCKSTLGQEAFSAFWKGVNRVRPDGTIGGPRAADRSSGIGFARRKSRMGATSSKSCATAT